MAGEKSFDRVAEIYDSTRGGERRGRQFATELYPLFERSGPALEVGIGTGVVAKALIELGRPVVGVDVSPLMLSYALDRIGARVAVAAAERLPLRNSSMDNTYAVWVLHLVDVPAVMREVARILRPGGRFVACPVAIPEPDAILEITSAMYEALLDNRERKNDPDRLSAAGEAAGLRVESVFTGKPQTFIESPWAEASRIESKHSAALWDVDDETWERIVAPTITALRELPDVEMERVSHPKILVFER